MKCGIIRNTTMIQNTMTTTSYEPHQKPPVASLTNTLRLISFYCYLIATQKAGHSFCENMQNKPNLNNLDCLLSAFLKMTYLPPDTWCDGKNKPTSNPIQSQTNPISTSNFLFKNPPPADIIPPKAKFTFTRRKK